MRMYVEEDMVPRQALRDAKAERQMLSEKVGELTQALEVVARERDEARDACEEAVRKGDADWLKMHCQRDEARQLLCEMFATLRTVDFEYDGVEVWEQRLNPLPWWPELWAHHRDQTKP